MIYLFITLPHTFFEKTSKNKIKIIITIKKSCEVQQKKKKNLTKYTIEPRGNQHSLTLTKLRTE